MKKRRKKREAKDELRREYDLSKLKGVVRSKNSARQRAKARKPGRAKPRIIKDPITGLAVLSFGKNAPKLASEQVHALLADFP